MHLQEGTQWVSKGANPGWDIGGFNAYIMCVSSWGVRSFIVLCISVPSGFFTGTVRLYVYSLFKTICFQNLREHEDKQGQQGGSVLG